MSFGVIEKVCIHKSYICAQFSKVLYKWEVIGHMLGVPNSDLAIIKRDHRAYERCCEEMFRKWLQSHCTPCSWKTILAALAIVGEEALAEEIVPKLSSLKVSAQLLLMFLCTYIYVLLLIILMIPYH